MTREGRLGRLARLSGRIGPNWAWSGDEDLLGSSGSAAYTRAKLVNVRAHLTAREKMATLAL